jgi:hypothetical protein
LKNEFKKNGMINLILILEKKIKKKKIYQEKEKYFYQKLRI